MRKTLEVLGLLLVLILLGNFALGMLGGALKGLLNIVLLGGAVYLGYRVYKRMRGTLNGGSNGRLRG